MKQLLLVIPVLGAVLLSACNMNNEVNNPSGTSEETMLEDSRSDEMMEEDRMMMDASPSPMSTMMPENERMMMEDDGATIRMEGGVDSGM